MRALHSRHGIQRPVRPALCVACMLLIFLALCVLVDTPQDLEKKRLGNEWKQNKTESSIVTDSQLASFGFFLAVDDLASYCCSLFAYFDFEA